MTVCTKWILDLLGPPPPPWPCNQGLQQNSECVPPVLIHRAIACDSFKVLAQKAIKELCDNKKKTQNPTFYTPPHNVAAYYGFTLDVRVSVRPSVICTSVRPFLFLFPDDNLSKHHWIFTKFGMCIDIVDIWFGIANGQISLNLYGVICPRHAHIFVPGR